MLKLKLERPIAFFDIESTGTNRRADRIIDLAIVKILPNGKREEHTFRVNPGMPIPPESTRIHHITDEDVKNSPTFKDVAEDVAKVLEECDLGGYNISGFDIPVLCEEFARAGVPFSMDGRCIVDAQRIFHKKVPRDLPAALAYYCGELHVDAHSALGDVDATIRVMESQLAKYTDLPADVSGLDEFCNPRDPSWVDKTGKFKWDADGEAVINFGKKQGTPLRKIAEEDPGFLKWMVRSDFPADTRAIADNALRKEFPARPSTGNAASSDDA